MNNVLERLNSDWDFIADFLSNPEMVLRDYNLSEDERLALTSRNPNALMGLGASRGLVQAAFSGAHSDHGLKSA